MGEDVLAEELGEGLAKQLQGEHLHRAMLAEAPGEVRRWDEGCTLPAASPAPHLRYFVAAAGESLPVCRTVWGLWWWGKEEKCFFSGVVTGHCGGGSPIRRAMIA
jgi:hypothetical protein